MGVTSTLTYLGPFLALPMTITVRLFVLGLVQVLMCLMETAETILRQVSIAKENTVVVHTSLHIRRFNPTNKEYGYRRSLRLH